MFKWLPNRKESLCEIRHSIMSQRSPTEQDHGQRNDLWVQYHPWDSSNPLNPEALFFHDGNHWILYQSQDVVDILRKRIQYLEEKYDEKSI